MHFAITVCRWPRRTGFLEITPEREYLLVTSFVDEAVKILDAPIDDTVIAGDIELIRSLLDAGRAYRDIKPSDLLRQRGQALSHRRLLFARFDRRCGGSLSIWRTC
jgi:hypothetical protein